MSEAAPRVSVLLPVRNGRATLARALQSLLDQTLEDFEVIAIDDGSTDQTWDVLQEHARQDRRIWPERTGPKGLVPALDMAVEKARAPYLARMDCDDLCLPERLELQAAHLDAHPETGLVACRVAFGGDRRAAAGYARYVDWTNTLLDHDQISLARFRESPLAHPSVMFRASLVRDYGGYRLGDFPEDYELWLRWLEQGVRMAKLDQELLVWNDPPHRLSRTHQRYDPQAFYRIKAEYLGRWLARNNPLHPEVAIIGSGRTSRKRADLLLEHGVRITAYIDIDPRKIGHVIHGIPVLHRDEIPGPGQCFAVSYVGSHGADQDIGDFLQARGFLPGRDFILAA